MKKLFLILIFTSLIFGIEYSKKEQQFLKNHPVIYISAMTYWPVDKNGESFHTNYIKLLNKYGHINLQPVFYQHWENGFDDAKKGITNGIMALSYSKQREKWFFFTKTYNYHPYYLIVNKNSDIYSLQDLKNKTIAIAKNSILREVFKNPDFKIISTKHAFKKIINNQLDGIMLFYVNDINKNKYRIIKVFIDKNGEEHIGINKKYPELYSIISKIMKTIPYNEIESIRNHVYKKIKIEKVFTPKITLKDLITKKDILFLSIFSIGLIIIIFLVLTRKFLNFQMKNFFISIFIFNSFIIGFIIYEILVFNFYSNKILEIKSKSFNSIYLISELEDSIINLNHIFLNKYSKQHANIKKLFKHHTIKADNLLINKKTLKYLINHSKFTSLELTHIATIKNQIEKLLKLQQEVLNNKTNIQIYKQQYILVINYFKKIKQLIKKENLTEIKMIQEKLKYQFLLLIFSAILFIIESIFVFIMIKKKLYNPITYLTNIIQMYKKGKNITKKEYQYKDEIGDMIDEFISLQHQLNQNLNELKQHKKTLEKQVKEEVDKRIYQEKILLKQSRLALMGEMIDAIAHQWKQPLNAISLHLEILNLDKENIDKHYIEKFIHDINLQMQHMISTLTEFRNFFRDDKEKELVCIKDVIDNSLILLKDELIKNKIEIKKDIQKNFCIEAIKTELEHLIITLITNAKDIFNERNIQNRYINIKSYEDDTYFYLEIIDNAGGVPEDIKDKIFDLNYTTRKDGTGVGLYLASQIAIKHMGSLEVKNTQNGACFYFKIRK